MAIIKELNADNFDETIANGTVLVDFWATWCNPCKTFGKILEEVAKEVDDSVVIGKVEIEENPTLAVRFSVTNIPYIVLFRNGEAVTELYGIQSKAKLIALLSE
jgi:thioredoxin 1